MPDFDKIHSGPGPYQKPARQFLEGVPTELIIESTTCSIMSSLKHYGNETLDLLLELASYIEQLPTGPLFKDSTNWSEHSAAIDRIIQRAPCKNKRGSNTAQRVAKRQLLELQTGIFMLQDQTRTLLSNYIIEIVKDSFEDPVKRLLFQRPASSTAEHLDTLADVCRMVRPKISNLVEQLMQARSVDSLRKPPRGRVARNTATDVAEPTSIYTDDIEAISM